MDATQLKLGKLDNDLLEHSGILRQNPECQNSLVLSQGAVSLFVLVAQYGEEGMPLTHIPKELKSLWQEYLLELEVQGLADKVRNAKGHYSHIQLTWQGVEALEKFRAANKVNRKRRGRYAQFA